MCKDYITEKCIKYPGAKFGTLEICIWDLTLQTAFLTKTPSALIVSGCTKLGHIYMYCVQFIH